MTFCEKTGEVTVIARQNYILIATLFVAAILLLFRNIPVGPIPAGDEFAYSMMSRQIPYSQDWIPNYLYYFVYSSTNYCGREFYACVKLINVLFLLLAATFVFLTGRLFVGWFFSFLIMVGFLASPFNVFSSMFMPETMYAAAAWLLLYFYLSRRSDWVLRDTVAAGLGIALLSMIKPHGAFFGIVYLGAIVFELLFARKSSVKVVAMNAAAFIGSFLVLRLSFGALFAGTRGLSILGSTYGGLAENHSLIDYVHVVMMAATPAVNHVVAMSLVAGVPFCILLTRAFRASAEGPLASRLVNFAAIFFIVMIGIVSVFTATVLDGAAETLVRLHTRYYDFFIFLFYLAAVAELTRRDQPKLAGRVLAGGVVLLLALLSVFYLPSHFTQGLVDNPEVHGLFWSNKYLYVFASVNIALIGFWAFNSRAAAKLFLFIQVPLVAVATSVLLNRDVRSMAEYQYQYPYAKAGILARDIWGQPPPNYFVAGQGVASAWHTHFHVDKPGSRIELAPNETLRKAAIPRDVTAGIIIGNNSTDFPYVTTYTDGPIRIIRIPAH
ncbi:MAG TPA: hypothetical protein VFW22_15735 [Pseudolabrys sp.]|nr:hypothetical protein [Pseudolabrys sp.]